MAPLANHFIKPSASGALVDKFTIDWSQLQVLPSPHHSDISASALHFNSFHFNTPSAPFFICQYSHFYLYRHARQSKGLSCCRGKASPTCQVHLQSWCRPVHRLEHQNQNSECLWPPACERFGPPWVHGPHCRYVHCKFFRVKKRNKEIFSESCQESSALHFITSLGIADLIGNNEVTLDTLSAKSGVDPHYLGVTMSCLMGRGYFEEVGGFGSHIYRNNALSEILRKDGISGLKSGIGFLFGSTSFHLVSG